MSKQQDDARRKRMAKVDLDVQQIMREVGKARDELLQGKLILLVNELTDAEVAERESAIRAKVFAELSVALASVKETATMKDVRAALEPLAKAAGVALAAPAEKGA